MDPSPCLIEDVSPTVDGGRWSAKGVAGDPVAVEATILRDGTDIIRAAVLWRRRGTKAWSEAPMELAHAGLDRWRGSFTPLEEGAYEFALEAWTDRYATWLADLRKRVEAGMDVASEALEGAALLESISRKALGGVAERLRDQKDDARAVLSTAAAPETCALVERHQKRHLPTRTAPFPLTVDRERAVYGAWYEMFPRSYGDPPGTHGTFRTAARELPRIAEMGFDVLYLPPIHPIGTTKRKGRNNALVAGPDDPGSPWGIGSSEGGHDAVHPSLGTLEDFRWFVQEAARHGLEVALDIALQCSPDHPWVKEHPRWFRRRLDGTIRFAENPPKKYEDIYPLDFETDDREALWNEIRRVFLHWCAQGVRIFRVDNPHTKPIPFWAWLISEIRTRHPETIFLAEAFTRPRVMYALAQAGFTQSYTYFTWRNTKRELMEYLTELSTPPVSHFFRPNFFANTPDILAGPLVRGSPAAFRMRLVLAATLSPSYGIYSGFEICENEPHPTKEEYAENEKYEIKVRDWNRPGHIIPFVKRINEIRRSNPAFHRLHIQFLGTDNDAILAYARETADGSNRLIVVVNLDPHRVQESSLWVPEGWAGRHRFRVRDLLTDETYDWGARNYVRLDPARAPAHLLKVEG